MHNDFAALECGIGVAPTLCNDTSLNTQWSLNTRNASQIFSYTEFDKATKVGTVKYVWVREMPSLLFSKLPMSWYEFIRAKVLRHETDVTCVAATDMTEHDKYDNPQEKRLSCKTSKGAAITLDPIQYLL